MILCFGHPLLRVAVLGVVLSVLPGCGLTTAGNHTASDTTATAAARPKVVVTHVVLCDLTQQIAAETIALTCLSTPGGDPHTAAPTPSDRKAIEAADLILMNGYNLEPKLEQLVTATSAETETIAVAEVARASASDEYSARAWRSRRAWRRRRAW